MCTSRHWLHFSDVIRGFGSTPTYVYRPRGCPRRSPLHRFLSRSLRSLLCTCHMPGNKRKNKRKKQRRPLQRPYVHRPRGLPSIGHLYTGFFPGRSGRSYVHVTCPAMTLAKVAFKAYCTGSVVFVGSQYTSPSQPLVPRRHVGPGKKGIGHSASPKLYQA